MKKRKPDEIPIRATTPCPICGVVNYEWGHLGHNGASRKNKPGVFHTASQQVIQTRRCAECGNVQLFIPGDWNLP